MAAALWTAAVLAYFLVPGSISFVMDLPPPLLVAIAVVGLISIRNEVLALDLAVAMTETPAEVSEDLRAALLEHLDDAQVTELASCIAWENHRARLNRALGVRAAGFSDGAFCLLPEHEVR